MDVVRAALRGAGMLAGVGLLAGGTGTLVGAVFRDDVPGLTSFAATVFRLLLVLLPLVVLLLLAGSDDEGDVGAGTLTRGQDAVAAMLAAGLGAIAATVLFLVVSTIAGPVVRRLDAIDYSVSLRAEIGAPWFAAVLLACLAAGAVVAARLARR